MKAIILLLVLLFTNSLCAQHHFLNRKYTKGRFVEKIRKLKHEKKMTSSLDSVNITYGLSMPCVEAQMTVSDSIHSGSCMSEHVTKNIKEDFYNVNIYHPKKTDNNDASAIPVTKHNTLLCNTNKNVVASLENTPFIVSYVSQHKSALAIKTQNRKSMLKLFLEWDNLKHLKITSYTPKAVALSLINYYQSYISPKKGFTCAHHALYQNEVSCSEYGKQAIERYGLVKGIYLTGKRLDGCGDAYQMLKVKHTSYKKAGDLWDCDNMIDDCKKELLILLVGLLIVLVISVLLVSGIMPIGVWALLCALAFIVITTRDIINFYYGYSESDSLKELFIKIFVTNLLGIFALFILPFLILTG